MPVTTVGPEISCGAPTVVMMQSMDCRELDDLTLFGWMDRSAGAVTVTGWCQLRVACNTKEQ